MVTVLFWRQDTWLASVVLSVNGIERARMTGRGQPVSLWMSSREVYLHLRGGEWGNHLEKPAFNTPYRDLNLDLPIIGSLVYYKIDALEDLVANEAEQHQLETDVDHAVSSSYKQHQLEPDVERVQQIIQRALQDADWVLKKYKIETSKSKV
uniref:Uncharacterized protein n=1 Tax=Timema cristinae TaxID=61476 RepID=A0A7R9DGD2_TIMCR|nr:unnamed protein product [Timema cristinae]